MASDEDLVRRLMEHQGRLHRLDLLMAGALRVAEDLRKYPADMPEAKRAAGFSQLNRLEALINSVLAVTGEMRHDMEVVRNSVEGGGL